MPVSSNVRPQGGKLSAFNRCGIAKSLPRSSLLRRSAANQNELVAGNPISQMVELTSNAVWCFLRSALSFPVKLYLALSVNWHRGEVTVNLLVVGASRRRAAPRSQFVGAAHDTSLAFGVRAGLL